MLRTPRLGRPGGSGLLAGRGAGDNDDVSRVTAPADSASPADQPIHVQQARFCKPAPARPEMSTRIETDPFTLRPAQQVDGQIRVDEAVFREIENRTEAVALIGGHRHTLIGTGVSPSSNGQRRRNQVAQRPSKKRPPRPVSTRSGYPICPAPKGNLAIGDSSGPCGAGGNGWPGSRRERHIALALAERREARGFLLPGHEPRRKMPALRPASPWRPRPERADRYRAQQVAAEPRTCVDPCSSAARSMARETSAVGGPAC